MPSQRIGPPQQHLFCFNMQQPVSRPQLPRKGRAHGSLAPCVCVEARRCWFRDHSADRLLGKTSHCSHKWFLGPFFCLRFEDALKGHSSACAGSVPGDPIIPPPRPPPPLPFSLHLSSLFLTRIHPLSSPSFSSVRLLTPEL